MPRYSDEFRAEVISAAKASDKPRATVAREYGISPSTLYRWMRQDSATNHASDAEEPAEIGRIWIRGRDGETREIYPKRRETGDPELDALWDMPFQDLAKINRDPEHPLHEKSKQVVREIMAPLGEATRNLVRPAIQPVIDHMKNIAQISLTPGWKSNFAAQIAPFTGLNDVMKSIAEHTNISATFAEAVRAQLPKIDLMPHISLIQPHLGDASWTSLIAGMKPQLESVFAWQNERLRNLAQDAKWLLLLGVYPPNWHNRALDPVGSEVLRPLLREEGIVLAWAPDPDTLVQLLNAESPEERQQILSNRHDVVAEHCKEVLESAPTGRLDGARSLALSAVAALQSGHPHPAQALATNVLDGCINTYIPRRERNILVNRTSPSAFEREAAFRAAMVFDAITAAYAAEYRPERNLPVPSSYSRHATAHGISLVQYTPLNSLLAVMHATAVVMLFAHQLSEYENDDSDEGE